MSFPSIRFEEFKKIDFWVGPVHEIEASFSEELASTARKMKIGSKPIHEVSEMFVLYIRNLLDKESTPCKMPVIFNSAENQWDFCTLENVHYSSRVSLGAPATRKDLEEKERSIEASFLEKFDIRVGSVLEFRSLEVDSDSKRLKILLGDACVEVTLPDAAPSVDLRQRKVVVLCNLKPECKYDDCAHLFFTAGIDGKNSPFFVSNDVLDGSRWLNADLFDRPSKS